MIKIIKGKNDSTDYAIRQESGLFSGSTYYVGMNVCQDVKCNCGAGNILISTDKEEFNTNTVECVIPVNIHANGLNKDAKEDLYTKQIDKQTAVDFFENNLTPKDWHFLNLKYTREKFNEIEKVDLKDIEFTFTEEALNDTKLLFPYADIFEASYLEVSTILGVYRIYDIYCKDFACDCTEIVLKVFKVKDANLKDSTEGLIGDVQLNYKTFRANITSNKTPEIKGVLAKISEEYNEIEEILTRRNGIIRELYKKAGVSRWMN